MVFRPFRAVMRSLLAVLVILSSGCADLGSVRLDPARVEQTTMAGRPLLVVGLSATDVIETEGHDLRLAADLEVEIGGQQAEIVRWSGEGLVVRLGDSLPLGVHSLRVRAFGLDYAREEALEVVGAVERDGSLDGMDGGGMDGGAQGMDAGLDDAGIERFDGAVDPTDAAMDGGATAMDGGTDSGIDSGFDSGFDSGTDSGFDSGVDAGRDASIILLDAGRIDGGPTIGRPCPVEPSLRACFRFEGSVVDESGSMLSATASDVGYTPGLDGQALTTRPTSSIVVRHDAALDTTEYTVEAWVWLDSVPGPGDYYGVAEKYGHWRLRIDPGGAAACHIGTRWGRREISGGAVPPGPGPTSPAASVAAARWSPSTARRSRGRACSAW